MWESAPDGERWSTTLSGTEHGTVFAPGGVTYYWDGAAWANNGHVWDELDRCNFAVDWTLLNPGPDTVAPYCPADQCPWLNAGLACRYEFHGTHGVAA